MTLVLDLLTLATAGLAGCAAGLWIRGSEPPPSLPPSPDAGLMDRHRRQLAEAHRHLAKAVAGVLAAQDQIVAAEDRAAQDRHRVTQAHEERDRARQEAAEAHQSLAHLQQIVLRMTADVDAHSVRIREICDEIEDAADGAVVVNAVARLIEAHAQIQERLKSAEDRLRQQEEALQAQIAEARTDALTQLANRRAFDARLVELEQDCRDRQRPSSIMMLDVDHFKKLNDAHGHQAGDAVLREVGRVLTENVASDAVVYRYGGEEFAVIFAGCELTAARAAGERARAAVAEMSLRFEGAELRVTASGGVAELLPNEACANLVKRADDALYACKRAGRNCGYWHDGQGIHPMTPTRDLDETLDESPAETSAEVPAEVPSPVSVEDRSSLSTLSSRIVFEQDLERRLAEWRRGGPRVSVMLIEIDRFEMLSRSFGESAGDKMLRATAQILNATKREMDHAARLDSHQFVLMLPSACAEDAEGVAGRLRATIEHCKLPMDDRVLRFTVSTGVSQITKNDTAASVLDRACRSIRYGGRSELPLTALESWPVPTTH